MRSQRKYSSSMMPIRDGLIIFSFSFGTSARDIVVNSSRGLDTLLMILLSTTIGLPIQTTTTTPKERNYLEAFDITILEANSEEQPSLRQDFSLNWTI